MTATTSRRLRDFRELPHFTRIISAFSFIFLLLFIYIWQRPTVQHIPNLDSGAPFTDGRCTSEAWSAGTWERKTDPPVVIEPEDVYKASGFLGCASTREVQWHLSTDHPTEMNWRGHVSAYNWTPHPSCGTVLDDREVIVRDLVEQGGWLLIGDSVTEQHFFSLSCTLYPHVLATPDYTGRWDWDRAWPQNLYLNPKSPLVSQLNMPNGFDIEKTPLVTFRRVDLLFNHTELETIHNGGNPTTGPNSTLFGDEQSWDMSPVDYFNIFFSPLPTANYHTIIISTAGHWSLKLLEGLPNGYPDVFNLFRNAMTNWIYQAARYLDAYELAQKKALRSGKSKKVLIRAYLTGDDNCHSPKIQNGGPRLEPLSLEGASYNWEWIPKMNQLFKELVNQRGHPNIHYLDIERPGRLRPDAHALGDCLHWTVGAGVIEGWTRYIANFLHPQSSWLSFRRASSRIRRAKGTH